MVHQSLVNPSVSISRLSVEHARTGFGIGTSCPRLSWRFEGNVKDWSQAEYELRVERSTGREEYRVKTSQSVLVDWPSAPLCSGEKARIYVQAKGEDGSTTAWAEEAVEATLLEASDWQAELITCEPQSGDAAKRPFYVEKDFSLTTAPKSARLYATALGMYEIVINGRRVGNEVLKPGWTSYAHRLYFQTFDIAPFLKAGENTVRGIVAEGWYAGRLGFLGGKREIWGERNGLFAQIVCDGAVAVKTDATWVWNYGGFIASEIYDGETYDIRQEKTLVDRSAWKAVEVLPAPTGHLIPDLAPMRRIEPIRGSEILITPSGKTIVDFGQNLVGWVRLNIPTGAFATGDTVVLTHAEVLEDKELGIRPLRIAKCQDILTFGEEEITTWEPTFTFHGFRYLQIDGWKGDIKLEQFTAVVVHTDMERLGRFNCSHEMLNRLHSNVVWGMKGNFVGVPTDCPQRDERLGWTGDLQAFCRTANFLYDTHDMLGGWLQDLAVEQLQDNNGVPPLVVPNALSYFKGPKWPLAIWGDVSVLAPVDLFDAFGDISILEEQWESMYTWLDKGIQRGENGLWDLSMKQLGDWLDPKAPPDFPGDGQTDPVLVANCFLLHVTRHMSGIANTLGKAKDAKRFHEEFDRLLPLFLDEYVTKNGRIVSDSQTALALALRLKLLNPQQQQNALTRLDNLIRSNVFKVGTGFAGTPILLDTLAQYDQLHLAYRMLQEKQCPSWLYCVSMGATTIWERWDSMRPDGSINPGEMTSFNHYALGAVATFMHEAIGGISPLEPGWKRVLVKPQPGGTITSADVEHISPYGRVACSWRLADGKLRVKVTISPNSTAEVVLGGEKYEIGSGERDFEVDFAADERWPPKPIWDSMTIPLIDEIA